MLLFLIAVFMVVVKCRGERNFFPLFKVRAEFDKVCQMCFTGFGYLERFFYPIALLTFLV